MTTRFLTTETGRDVGDHVCWPFHGMDELVPAMRAYVLEGLSRHELVTFCRFTSDGMEHTDVPDVARVGRPDDGHRPVLTPLVPEAGWTPEVSPIGPFGRMTGSALAGGFAGLRVMTDVTEMVRDHEARLLWMRAEHQIDRYSLDHPLTILCGYDVDDLGDDVVAQAARLHALTRGEPCPFLLHASDVRGGLALSGEVDGQSAADLYDAVVTIAPEIPPGPVVLDLSELEFIDHAGLGALDRAARLLGTPVRLVEPSPVTAWLVDTLELTGVAVMGSS